MGVETEIETGSFDVVRGVLSMFESEAGGVGGEEIGSLRNLNPPRFPEELKSDSNRVIRSRMYEIRDLTSSSE